MRLFRNAPAVGQVPTVSDGYPPDLDIQEQVVSNQVRAAAQWDDTERDMVLSDIINERDAKEDSRRQALILALVTLFLFIVGLAWTYNSIQHDRLVNSQRAAATQTPYTPETIR
jgi:hypothetical protein